MRSFQLESVMNANARSDLSQHTGHAHQLSRLFSQKRSGHAIEKYRISIKTSAYGTSKLTSTSLTRPLDSAENSRCLTSQLSRRLGLNCNKPWRERRDVFVCLSASIGRYSPRTPARHLIIQPAGEPAGRNSHDNAHT